MEVYHGTILNFALNIEENGIDLTKSNEYLDFGRGFYVTPDKKMAENMAKRVAVRYLRTIKNPIPAVVTFEYDENINLKIKKFYDSDIEWAKFIFKNRVTEEIATELHINENDDEQYDIVIGETADGNIATIAADLRTGKTQTADFEINISDFLKDDGKTYGTQIVFCTKDALSCIKYIKYDIIKM